MDRLYEHVMQDHLKSERQMLFLVGPRQVGKTTASLEVSTPRPRHYYFNLDIQKDRALILEGPDAVAVAIGLNEMNTPMPIVVFDELHKYRKWKNFLKGFFDKYSRKVQIIVTGSARLDIYKAGGDSLMGRYFLYRLHPLSVAEIIDPSFRNQEIHPRTKKISDEDFKALFEFGGFPEPYLKRTQVFYNRWKKLRFQQLFQEDMRDLTRIQDIKDMEILATLLKEQIGDIANFSSLAKKVNVTIETVSRWIEVLRSFYYCFTLQPWTKNITRSLLKEPKMYLWDWSLVEDPGAKVENFIASHLLKAVHFWTDLGLGDYGLYYLRDKEKREVDFLVTKNRKPWFIVEVKKSDNGGVSKALYRYQEMTKVPHAFQVSFEMDYVEGDCFSYTEPVIVPAKSFLSQLI